MPSVGVALVNLPRLFAVATVLLLLPSSTTAQTFGDVGSRAEGMGRAFVAVADDATAVYWNPAGLATGSNLDAQIFAARQSTVFFGVAMPALGLSFFRTHIDTSVTANLPTVPEAADRQNEGSGEVQLRRLTTNNFGITILQTIVNTAVIGTTVRLVRGGLEDADGETHVDFDMGAMYSVGNVRLGVTARNLRQPEFQKQSAPISLERQVRVGAAVVPRSLPAGVHGPFSLAFDADLTRTPTASGDVRDAAIGGEYWLRQGQIGTRAGVRWSTLTDGNRAISGGVTARLPHSVFAEGHVTKSRNADEVRWGLGARITF